MNEAIEYIAKMKQEVADAEKRGFEMGMNRSKALVKGMRGKDSTDCDYDFALNDALKALESEKF